MASHLHYLLILISLSQSKRDYDFKLRVTMGSCACFPATVDQLYFRLCRNSLCSTWISVPNGLQTNDKEYSWTVTTPTDYGPITKAQVIHMGDDQLCIDHIKVDFVEYDWGMTTYCFDSGTPDTDPACNTLTVSLSTNDWSTSTSDPCDYASEFDDTYSPTPIPTLPTVSPTNPTKAPTDSPTPAPTSNPTFIPTNQPTTLPTKDPTNDPTNDPTYDPTINPTEPTAQPTNNPTLEPTVEPTNDPTWLPTLSPTNPTAAPTLRPTTDPTHAPTGSPFGEMNADPDATNAYENTDFTADGSQNVRSTAGNTMNYGVLVGVIFAALFCITFLILTLYCCHVRRKKGIEMNFSNRGELEQRASVYPDLPKETDTANIHVENVSPGDKYDENGESQQTLGLIQMISDDDKDELYNPSHASDANVCLTKGTSGGDVEMMYRKTSEKGDTTTQGYSDDSDSSKALKH